MNEKPCKYCEKEWVSREEQGDLWQEVYFNPEKAYMTIKAKNDDLRKYNELVIQIYYINYCPWCGRKLEKEAK